MCSLETGARMRCLSCRTTGKRKPREDSFFRRANAMLELPHCGSIEEQGEGQFRDRSETVPRCFRDDPRDTSFVILLRAQHSEAGNRGTNT